ncbi:hypothetical protein T12_7790 [Trichinella patagoniensis]|uniref:Uncharacterized protein n=1 Tax=Trichinella patagoniensis TaxID=990121 RepID=A0A0V0ZCA5_9BILA|nr:hypothetical protein T12_7790 [Trichinella patagoniensis]
MPSGKRETERKVNAPVNTGPSPNSDEHINNPTEGADEPARGSGPLHRHIGMVSLEKEAMKPNFNYSCEYYYPHFFASSARLV